VLHAPFMPQAEGKGKGEYPLDSGHLSGRMLMLSPGPVCLPRPLYGVKLRIMSAFDRTVKDPAHSPFVNATFAGHPVGYVVVGPPGYTVNVAQRFPLTAGEARRSQLYASTLTLTHTDVAPVNLAPYASSRILPPPIVVEITRHVKTGIRENDYILDVICCIMHRRVDFKWMKLLAGLQKLISVNMRTSIFLS